MKYITNKYDSVRVPYTEDMLVWLQKVYPKSKYRVVTV